MSENLTGKYLDGAGLSKVWEKVKSYSSSNYLPLSGGSISGNLSTSGTLSVGGTLNVNNKVVIGTPTSDLAGDIGGIITDTDIYTSGLISYVPAYFKEGVNCATLTADSIIVGDNKTGFLKANGTIDDTNYLPLTGGTTDFLNSTKITVGNFGQLTGGENDGFDLYVIGSAYARSFRAMQVNLSGSITSNNQATTKKYVDDKVSAATSSLGNYLPLTGGTLTGPLTLTGTDGNGTITAEDLIAKNGLFVGRDAGENTWPAVVGMNYETGYFTGQAMIASGSTENDVFINIIPAYNNDPGSIDIVGSVNMTGDLSASSISLNSAITVDSQATTKKYVDDKVSAATSSLGNYLPLTGGNISGNLSVGGTLNVTGGTSTEAGLIVPSIDIRNFVTIGTPPNTDILASVGSDPVAPKLGLYSYLPAHFEGGLYCDTISSDSITLSSAITSDNQATTKKYVDDKVNTSLGNYLPLTGGTLTGNLILSDHSLKFVDSGDLTRINLSVNNAIFNTSISANSGINASRITLSNTITANNQATTKKYVDDKVSTAISSLNEVLKFKGSINSTSALPTSAELGWVYVVSEAGTYAGETCEVGDMIICTTASTTAPTWTIIQRNIPGVMSNDEIDSICTY